MPAWFSDSPQELARISVVTKDVVYSFFFLLSFFLLIPLSHENLSSLLLPGNKCDRLETLTQYAECSQFAVNYIFFGNMTSFTGGFSSSNISRNDRRYAVPASYL